MFDKLKKWYREACLRRWLREGYDPLFAFRKDLETKGLAQILGPLEWFEDLVKELRATEGKDEQQIIRERWQALQFERIIEHYQTTIEELDVFLDRIPKPPVKLKPLNITIYNDFNRPNDDF